MNSAQFKGQLMTLAELTNKEFSTDAVPRYWWETFGDLPDDLLLQAFAVAKRTSKFFPSPQEFDEIIRQIGRKSGTVVDGASAWDVMQRDLFGCWSEVNDRVNVRVHGYPWPNERCKQLLRGQLNCTVRDVVEMHPAEYAKTRAAFIALYDGAALVEQAQATMAKIAPPPPAPLAVVAPPPLRRISGGDA